MPPMEDTLKIEIRKTEELFESGEGKHFGLLRPSAISAKLRAFPGEDVSIGVHFSRAETASRGLVLPLMCPSAACPKSALYATRSSAAPRFLGFTTISTSCPSATRKRIRRSTE